MAISRKLQHRADQIDAGEDGVNRLDQPRIDVDDQRSAVGDDDVHRDRPVPAECLHQPLEVLGERGQHHALLDRCATADALEDTQIGVVGDQPAMVGERLDHRERARGLCLHQ